MTATALPILHGALCALSLVAALFFARYGWLTRDRFFVWFAAAFVIFAANWLMLAIDDSIPHHPPFYLVRLAGFVMILIAILVKNRSPARP
jgi:hypothetical protein|nr:DUF5985 family protein [Kofleriaceae bacterium]